MNVTLYGRRDFDFIDVIKLGILALGKLSWSIQVDLKYNHKCPYKRGAKGDLTTKDGIGDVMLKARCWRVQGGVTIKECRKPPETGRGKEGILPYSPQEKSALLTT